MHFLLGADAVGLGEDGLLLRLGHAGLDRHGLFILRQRHAKTDGNLREIHGITSRG